MKLINYRRKSHNLLIFKSQYHTNNKSYGREKVVVEQKLCDPHITQFWWWYFSSGFWHCVDSLVDANNLEKHTVSIFCPEDGDSMFLQNTGIYQVYVITKPKRTAHHHSPPPWKPKPHIIKMFNVQTQQWSKVKKYQEQSRSTFKDYAKTQ
jgi:hypothetical protein